MKVKVFGECQCGKTISAKGDLAEFEFEDGKHSWKGFVTEHFVVLCPQCGRLINLT